MQPLPIIDRFIRRASVTDLNRMKREELKQALNQGAVYVLLADRREDIGVVMGLDTYDRLTQDMRQPARGRKRAEPEPQPELPVEAASPEPDVNEGLDLPWR
jgi:hypothetical protein